MDMVSCVLRPCRLSGTARPPPSLPLAKRMLWAACLGDGGVIGNCPDNADMRAILDLGAQLGADAVMENILGEEAADWQALAAGGGALHLYGKRDIRPGRKMGHITRVYPLGTIKK